jgi:hypothetical protein
MSPWKGAKFDSENFEQGADGAFGISLQKVCYCDTSYALELYKEPRTAPNGRLDIAELRPKEGTLPSFLFRWDEKDNQLDVDIQGVSSTVKKCFKNGIGGYKGHHPQQVQSEGKGRIFEVDIRIPEKRIFHGCMTFGINHMAKAAVSTGNKVSTRSKFVSQIKSVVKRKPN